MDVGRQEGHQLQTELDLTREKQKQRHEKNTEIVDSAGNIQLMLIVQY